MLRRLEAIDYIMIRPNAGTTEDDIPAVIPKQCKSQLSYPIFTIRKKSKATGLVPQVLKEPNSMLIVATVFKKGEKTDPAYYRPVVLTSHLIKIHKRIVRKRVMAFLVDKTLSHSPDCKILLNSKVPRFCRFSGFTKMQLTLLLEVDGRSV